MLRKKLDTNREMSNVVSTFIFQFSIPWFFLSHLVNKCVAHHLTAINLLVSFYFNLVYVKINIQIHSFGIFSTFQYVFLLFIVVTKDTQINVRFHLQFHIINGLLDLRDHQVYPCSLSLKQGRIY